MFQDLIGTNIGKEDGESNLVDQMKTASMLADVALDCSETRWGKG